MLLNNQWITEEIKEVKKNAWKKLKTKTQRLKIYEGIPWWCSG